MSILIAVSILMGFHWEIPRRLQSMEGQLFLTPYAWEKEDAETFSMHQIQDTLTQNLPYRMDCKPYIYRSALIKTKERVKGVFFKGTAFLDDKGNYATHMPIDPILLEGRSLDFSASKYAKECLLPMNIAQELRIQVGDSVVIHFLETPMRYRRLAVVGLFQTGIEELDAHLAVGDIRLLQGLLSYSSSQTEGMELLFSEQREISASVSQEVMEVLDYSLQVQTFYEKYPQIFEWLNLLARNAYIFLILVLLVAGFNMVAICIIFITERTFMIAVLKTLGLRKRAIQWLFWSYGMIWVSKGMLFGILCAAILLFIQHEMRWISLDPINYVLEYVPVRVLWKEWGVYIGLVWLALMLALAIPLHRIARLHPIKGLRR